MSFTSMSLGAEAPNRDSASPTLATSEDPTCYSVTVFTQRWREVRNFYVDLLKAKVLSERSDRYCEMELGGVPICLRMCECGEAVSYFHLYLSLKDREPILMELRQRGIIVTMVGPYANFRDPEGRVIKMSPSRTIVG